MKNLSAWFYVLGTVAIALTANSISAIWAKNHDKFSIWLLALLIVSPMVFISFGLATTKFGVAISSGTIDSLLTLSTILVGLLVFGEWDEVSSIQYMGMGLAVVGIFLMLFFPKAGT
jgi:multidrug transporter EmrE-like cation transporter